MELSGDLGIEVLREALPGRPIRAYPALLSTESDALAWARAGAPHGAVVVADYQASPRGRGGLVWHVVAGRDLAFSLVLRPELPTEREGWLYTAATCGLAEACGNGATIAWPDEVHRDGGRVAAVGVHVEPGPRSVAWAVASVILPGLGPPRAASLGRTLQAIDDRLSRSVADVLAEHRVRCGTLGRRVRALLAPMGPNGREVAGIAATTLEDGALVIATDEGRRLAVPPQALGMLEVADGAPTAPPG